VPRQKNNNSAVVQFIDINNKSGNHGRNGKMNPESRYTRVDDGTTTIMCKTNTGNGGTFRRFCRGEEHSESLQEDIPRQNKKSFYRATVEKTPFTSKISYRGFGTICSADCEDCRAHFMKDGVDYCAERALRKSEMEQDTPCRQARELCGGKITK
jgi:hypothetical protein